MHIVEIPRDGEGLASPMTQMRMWLDARRIEPATFGMSLIAGGTIFRLAFRDRRDAAAFARAFSGIVLPQPGDRPVAA
ncbi:MAG: hypothetical protein E6G72_16085 [Alphaproteobacteria bacterium]|nr:MAG: hypothetical protein E6G72_16085 [Alphaproteobacteria bacterium]